MNLPNYLRGSMVALGVAGVASAQVTFVNQDIQVATVWSGEIHLDGEVHVLDGATLTILAGTVIKSDTTLDLVGLPGSVTSSLTVDRGAQIFAQGTLTQPIVFTSTSETGSYRQNASNEWGGVTIHGEGYMNTQRVGTNTPAPSSANYGIMEGLSRGSATYGMTTYNGLREYGGGKVVTTFPSGWTSDGQGDNDDSGDFTYVSVRYNGKTLAAGVEMNPLGLGAVGRETNIHHFESINSLDDGIEIYGGTVNLKYLVAWSCGDDSFDVDQGWRGKAQHGLLVQGYNNVGGSQGSGIGDNCLEIDGAEFCHYQPITTAVIANFTVIGQPDPIPATVGNGGDHGTAWRDNARVQFQNCLFMDLGDRLVSNDGTDGEAGNVTGYGCNGTLSWATTWTTSSAVTSLINPFPGGFEATAAEAYTAQIPGNLIQFRDTCLWNNTSPTAYTEATLRNVLPPYGGGSNNANNIVTGSLPINAITRGAAVTFAGLSGSPSSVDMAPVTFVDPLPATADAWTSVEWLNAASGLEGSRYRGGFGKDSNWLPLWTGVAAYGLVPNSNANVDLGRCFAGAAGCPQLSVTGTWAAGSTVTAKVANLDPLLTFGILVAGFDFEFNFPIFGHYITPFPVLALGMTTTGIGTAELSWTQPTGMDYIPGRVLYMQAVGLDTTLVDGWSFSNATRHVQP
jgi:hypothetical protein